MIKIFCDRCGEDCKANAYLMTIEVIHNPAPCNAKDIGSLKITDDNTFYKQILCQKCYAELKLPNPYMIKDDKTKW